MTDKKEFYKKLVVQLDETTLFPCDYLYKFIVPTDENQTKEVSDLFTHKGAVITTKKSKTGKYRSVSIMIKLESSTEVIEYYKKAEKIKGIISL
jgi:hypothetical protein